MRPAFVSSNVAVFASDGEHGYDACQQPEHECRAYMPRWGCPETAAPADCLSQLADQPGFIY